MPKSFRTNRPANPDKSNIPLNCSYGCQWSRNGGRWCVPEAVAHGSSTPSTEHMCASAVGFQLPHQSTAHLSRRGVGQQGVLIPLRPILDTVGKDMMVVTISTVFQFHRFNKCVCLFTGLNQKESTEICHPGTGRLDSHLDSCSSWILIAMMVLQRLMDRELPHLNNRKQTVEISHTQTVLVLPLQMGCTLVSVNFF